MSRPQRKLKNWLATYDEYTRPSEAPQALHFWTGVSTIAGALRRRVWIEMRSFQWTPNFYIIFVGPPGIVTKSTSIGVGLQLLRQVPGVYIGPNSLTWQALIKSLEDAATLVKFGKDDSGDQQFLPMSCITCSIRELGTFLVPSDVKLMDVFTDLWDAQLGLWEHSTATQGKTQVENAWLNMISATTPSWLRTNFPESMVGGGLTSRMIFIFADKKRQLVAYPGLVEAEEVYKETEKNLVHDLQLIASLIGQYALTEEAVIWGHAWYEKHWDERPKHLSSDRFGGYIARKQTHIHKLAMVLAAAQRDELTITKKDLIDADFFVSNTEEHMLQVFESIGVSDVSKDLTEILSHLSVYRTMEQKPLWRKCMKVMSPTAFREALQSGSSAGFIRIANNGKDVTYSIITDPGVDK